MKRILIILLICVCIVVIVFDILLVRKNRVLSAQLENKIEVAQGTIVPPMRGLDWNGETIVVNPSGKRDMLLFVFSATCPFCTQNWPNWKFLATALDRRNVDVVFIDLSAHADERYLRAHVPEDLTTISDVDPSMLMPYHLGTVPQTILVGKDLRVKGVWTGVLNAQDERDISAECSSDDGETPRSPGSHSQR